MRSQIYSSIVELMWKRVQHDSARSHRCGSDQGFVGSVQLKPWFEFRGITLRTRIIVSSTSDNTCECDRHVLHCSRLQLQTWSALSWLRVELRALAWPAMRNYAVTLCTQGICRGGILRGD